LSSDFGGSFSSDSWVREILESSIATSIDDAAGGVVTLGDDIDTWFADTLSGADAATFNALPASHWTVITDTTTVDVGTTLSPPVFSGNVNNYRPDGWDNISIVRLDPGVADRDITGFDAPDPVY
jgi:hypothetical protein